MSYIRTADAWADGVKQTLNPDGTNAGFNAGAIAGDPSALANGDIWYQSAANELRARINGATVALGAGGASPPFTDTNTLIKGSADATKLMRFEIDGFTAGATRVLTPPDANITLAGQDFANVFTALQSIGGGGITLDPDGSAVFAISGQPISISNTGTISSAGWSLNPDGSAAFSIGGVPITISAVGQLDWGGVSSLATDGSLSVDSIATFDVTLAEINFMGGIISISGVGTLAWGSSASSLAPDGSISIGGGAVFSSNVTSTITDIGAGIIQVDSVNVSLGFFGATPVVQIAVVDLVNNTAGGGTADTIETFAGAVYATDSETILANFNQLAIKVNEIISTLRIYGLLVP